MFTDIVGFTALLGKDDKKGYELIRKNRKIHKAFIKKYNGTWLKEMGDGVLASFSAASSAIFCAIEIQQFSKKENIPLRIGIHEGEVLFEGNDIIGDGVNIASRLQEASEPGCITISSTVFNDVKNQPEIEVEFVDERTFKNVEEPIKIYNVVYNENDVSEMILVDEREFKMSKRKLLYFILTGIVVILIAVLILYNLPKQPVAELEKSIAVRPFWNESAEQENEYFVNGMTEDIRNKLVEISELRVISRGSMEKYRQTNLSTTQIANELDVNYLLEGTVQKLGNQVKIHVQLISAEDDDHLWEETYERDMSDVKEVFKIQYDIANSIAIELQMIISPKEKQAIETIPTENLEAYNLYLQGRHFWIQGRKDDLDKSIEYFKRALEIDPNYALAYAGMAVTYNSYGWFLYLPNKDIIPQARTAAMKALEIDNTLGEAHTELAFSLLLLDWDWSESEKEFKRALELNPNDARVHNMYAWLLTFVGRHDEAIEESKRAHELDPLSVEIWVDFGRRYYFTRDYDRAIEEYRKVLDFISNNSYASLYPHGELALALSMMGLHNKAIEEMSMTDYDPTWYSYLGYIYGVTGKRDQALEILNHYLELLKTEFFWNANVAIIYISLGEKDKAFELLEKSYEQREGWMPFLKVDPMFDSLRSDPRFQDLLERMNFPD